MEHRNIYRYDQALQKTIPPDSAYTFQLVCFVAITLGLYSSNTIVIGLSFLEKEPNSFECFYDEGASISNLE